MRNKKNTVCPKLYLRPNRNENKQILTKILMLSLQVFYVRKWLIKRRDLLLSFCCFTIQKNPLFKKKKAFGARPSSIPHIPYYSC